VVGFAGILAYFLAFAGGGLSSGFTHDDLMNLYRAAAAPVSRHLRDIVLFFTFSDSYRPLGTLFYRLHFDEFGFDPRPFRVACFVLLSINLWLAYALARRLTGSREAALLATLLFAYHPEFVWLYNGTGFVYDLLCFSTYNAAFLYYLKARERLGVLGWRQVTAWSALYVLCLNSKEMAVTLPVMIGVYELLVCPPESWRFADLRRWVLESGRVPVLGAALTLLFLLGRLRGPDALPAMDTYRPVLGLDVYLDRASHFLSAAFYHAEWLTPPVVLAIAVALAAGAVCSRLVPLRFGLAWMLIGISPVAFIQQRGLEAVVIPSLGLAMYLATSVVEGTRWAARRCAIRSNGASLAKRALALRPALVLLASAFTLISFQRRHGRIDFEVMGSEGRRIGSVASQVRRMLPEVPPGSRVFFLRDPFPESNLGTTFLVFLLFRDPSVDVQNPNKLLERPAQQDGIGFDVVLAYENQAVRRCDPSQFRCVRVGQVADLACR